MKKLLFILLFSTIMLSQSLGTYASNKEEDVQISGRSGILIEQESGRVLFSKNAHEERKIASITKIMTAILAIESGKLDDMVQISESASGVEGSSLYLKPGEKITLEDLTYGLMLRSGNDAAVAIAEYVGGSVEGFTYLMNEKARELGMNHSQFTNPHGLDDGDNHYSTAYDMALLMQYAMKNETFQKISQTERYRAPQEGEKWDRVWSNKNKLLTSLYEYCIGGKTGYTKSAGRTLVSAAEKQEMKLIAVTLDAPSDWDDHIAMFEWGFDHFTMKQLSLEKEEIKVEEIEDGFLYLPDTFNYPLNQDETIKRKLTLKQSLIKNSSQQDGVVGKLSWYIGEDLIHEMPVMYENNKYGEKGLFQKVRNILRAWTGGD